MADKNRTDVSSCLNLLEQRIKHIEDRVYSQNIADRENNGKVADIILEARKKLKDVEAKSPVVGMVFKQLNSLDNYLSAEFMERVSLTSDAKADIAILGEQKLQDLSENFKAVDSHKDVLDDRKLLDIQQHSSKLEPLVQVHIQQNEAFDEANVRLTEMLMTYNSIISSVSKQFVQWENILTQCEIALDTDQANKTI